MSILSEPSYMEDLHRIKVENNIKERYKRIMLNKNVLMNKKNLP